MKMHKLRTVGHRGHQLARPHGRNTWVHWYVVIFAVGSACLFTYKNAGEMVFAQIPSNPCSRQTRNSGMLNTACANPFCLALTFVTRVFNTVFSAITRTIHTSRLQAPECRFVAREVYSLLMNLPQRRKVLAGRNFTVFTHKKIILAEINVQLKNLILIRFLFLQNSQLELRGKFTPLWQ